MDWQSLPVPVLPFCLAFGGDNLTLFLLFLCFFFGWRVVPKAKVNRGWGTCSGSRSYQHSKLFLDLGKNETKQSKVGRDQIRTFPATETEREKNGFGEGLSTVSSKSLLISGSEGKRCVAGGKRAREAAGVVWLRIRWDWEVGWRICKTDTAQRLGICAADCLGTFFLCVSTSYSGIRKCPTRNRVAGGKRLTGEISSYAESLLEAFDGGVICLSLSIFCPSLSASTAGRGVCGPDRLRGSERVDRDEGVVHGHPKAIIQAITELSRGGNHQTTSLPPKVADCSRTSSPHCAWRSYSYQVHALVLAGSTSSGSVHAAQDAYPRYPSVFCVCAFSIPYSDSGCAFVHGSLSLVGTQSSLSKVGLVGNDIGIAMTFPSLPPSSSSSSCNGPAR